MGLTVVVCGTQEEVFEAAAQLICEKVPTSPAPGSFFSLVLSGGSTPRGLFRLLAAEPYRSQLPWTAIKIFWGDERGVPPDHPDSNYRMANEALLTQVPIPPQQVFRMEGELPVQEAATRYEYTLHQEFHLEPGVIPRFDLVLLGMGPDAHTASLFPGTMALQDFRQLVVANWVEKFQASRITLTPGVLNAAKEVVFLVSGKDKAQAVQAVFEGLHDPQVYPAQLVKPSSGHVTWIMDQDAAKLLKNTAMTNWISSKGKGS